MSNFLLSMTSWSPQLSPTFTSPVKPLVSLRSALDPLWSFPFSAMAVPRLCLHRPKLMVPSFISFFLSPTNSVHRQTPLVPLPACHLSHIMSLLCSSPCSGFLSYSEKNPQSCPWLCVTVTALRLLSDFSPRLPASHSLPSCYPWTVSDVTHLRAFALAGLSGQHAPLPDTRMAPSLLSFKSLLQYFLIRGTLTPLGTAFLPLCTLFELLK